MKINSTFTAILLALAFSASAYADLFTGETFTLSINASPGDLSSFEDITPSIGPFTIDGIPVDLGPSVFNPNVNIEVIGIEDVITNRNSIVTIFMVGVDGLGALANPIADGTLAANGSPFEIAFMDLGDFNGGTDGLFPILATNPNFVVNDSSAVVFGTDGNAGGLPFDFSSTSPDPITGFSGAGFGSDISTLDLNTVNSTIWTAGAEFAGWGVQFDITSLPEPGSLTILGLASLVLISRRRR